MRTKMSRGVRQVNSTMGPYPRVVAHEQVVVWTVTRFSTRGCPGFGWREQRLVMDHCCSSRNFSFSVLLGVEKWNWYLCSLPTSYSPIANKLDLTKWISSHDRQITLRLSRKSWRNRVLIWKTPEGREIRVHFIFVRCILEYIPNAHPFAFARLNLHPFWKPPLHCVGLVLFAWVRLWPLESGHAKSSPLFMRHFGICLVAVSIFVGADDCLSWLKPFADSFILRLVFAAIFLFSTVVL